jgi:hypothetical protein
MVRRTSPSRSSPRSVTVSIRWLTPSTLRLISLKRSGLSCASTWITYIVHLSAIRMIISRA